MGEKLPATWEEWERAVLESADEDGKVEAYVVEPYLAGISRLFSMAHRGLIERRAKHHEPGPWFITDAGRATLNT